MKVEWSEPDRDPRRSVWTVCRWRSPSGEAPTGRKYALTSTCPVVAGPADGARDSLVWADSIECSDPS